MEFQDLIRRRYSVREYLPTPVSEEALARILEAGRLAPTAANRQPFRIVVLHAAGRQEALGRVYARAWFQQAPRW
jgi:nitroreductase